MKLHDIKIGPRLAIGFGVSTALMIVIAGLAVWLGNDTSGAVSNAQRTAATASKVQDAWLSLRQMRASTWYYVATGDEQGIQDLKTASAAFETQYEDLNGRFQTAEDRRDLDEVRRFSKIYNDDFGIICRMRMMETGAPSSALRSKMEETKQATAVLIKALKILIQRESALNDEANRVASERIRLASVWSTMVGALGIVAGIICAYVISRSIARPITAMTTAMAAIASGDLAVEVPAISHRDEFGAMAKAVQIFRENGLGLKAAEVAASRQQALNDAERAANETIRAELERQQQAVVAALAGGLDALSNGDLTGRLDQAFTADYEKLRADFNATASSLEDALRTISTASTAIGSGTEEIAQASDDLSKRTEQQAASLEETAAALNLITATVTRMARGAGEAAHVVAVARGAAETSGAVVNQAIEAMSHIKASSNQITQIIGVIDEIAFQTNLLALNAGVEAARAGDAGRGFAVVASEVRALAQRSAEAAKEIKALIAASSKQVATGVDLVGKTGGALNEIIGKVSEIDVLVRGISASSLEQATGLAEVNIAIGQMDQVVQQNAAMVEETTAAAHSLRQETEGLTSMVARFQVSAATPNTRAGRVRSSRAA